MATTPRNFTNRTGAARVETLVERGPGTHSHFYDPADGPITVDINQGGQAGAVISGPWRDRVAGRDVVIVACADQPGSLSIEESSDGSSVASSTPLGSLAADVTMGARAGITLAKYRVTFTPTWACKRVHVVTQPRP